MKLLIFLILLAGISALRIQNLCDANKSEISVKLLTNLKNTEKNQKDVGNVVKFVKNLQSSTIQTSIIEYNSKIAVEIEIPKSMGSCDDVNGFFEELKQKYKEIVGILANCGNEMTTETDIEIIRTCLLVFAIIGIFGNINIILATRKNSSLQHKCGILLAILAVCDSICLINEFQSFLRMTLKVGETTLKKCFYANITYILIEPLEVYMIFILAVDRLIAINFSVFYRTIRKTKYVLSMLLPGLVIGAIFLIWSFVTLSNPVVDTCILPYAMPEIVSYWWNQYNLWGAVGTLLVYLYTYITVYCCTFKQKNEKNLQIQKTILNTVIVGAAVFSISSVLSATLIALFTNMKNPPIDPDTVSTYAVIPGLISYSCNFYVYFWRSSDYRNAFVKQLCCGRVLASQENLVSFAPPSSMMSKKSSSVSVMYRRADGA
ncbi:unnamed protein product [Caenorhabditis angaria]|uniref:G-protein coupled receptors family 1 profile domain-containing protein n=1 Tax=Caenorhabditis angaria TaxID=860376 RepID=A0A9P1IVP9_9PELO|nr:unnamed protein product [Caenorhabditis angaria]